MKWIDVRAAVTWLAVMVAVAAALVGIRQGVIAASAAWVTHLDVNEFTVQSFDAVYSLDRRANGRQDLQVVETIVVDFPRPELNHGIERSLPTSYRGRPLS